MDKLQDLKGKAGSLESAGQHEAALQSYIQAASLADGDPDPALIAKIGTLHLRVGDVGSAAERFEQATRLFEDAGLRNNALALCLRILAADPGRTDFYLRAGELSAKLGYRNDARTAFMEYAERLEAAGDLQEALRALRIHLRSFPDDAAIKRRLASLAGEPPPAEEEPVGSDDSDALPPALEDIGLVGNQVEGSGSTPATDESLPLLGTEPDPGGVGMGADFAPLEGLEPTNAGATIDEAAAEMESLPLLGTGVEEEPAAFDAPGDDADDSLPLLGTADPLPEILEALPQLEVPADDLLGRLRDRVAGDPSDLAAHRELVEYLGEHGSVAELEQALDGAHRAAAAAGEYGLAADYAARVAQVRPDDVGLIQSWAEYAFRSGDRQRLVAAYLVVARRFAAVGQADASRKIFERVVKLDPGNEEARRGAGLAPPPQEGDYIDFGAMVLGDEEESTRFQIEAGFPTGDEEHDFNEILSAFRQQIAEKIDPTDSASHYDLGVAFKEMGLWDDAITQLQRALRAGANPLATLEVLGESHVQKGEFEMAVRMLDRAVNLPGTVPGDLLGVHYWLGRSQEGLGNAAAARASYQLVMGMDPEFRDVAARLAALPAS